MNNNVLCPGYYLARFSITREGVESRKTLSSAKRHWFVPSAYHDNVNCQSFNERFKIIII